MDAVQALQAALANPLGTCNLNPQNSLVNGTRLVITRCTSHVLAAKAWTPAGVLQQDEVLIPRINFVGDNDGRMPFKMRRRQFPVAPAFAMTINKSQGQTLSTVGIFMTDQVFSHGQMYVALSRATSERGIKVLNLDTAYVQNPRKVQNVVWHEVL